MPLDVLAILVFFFSKPTRYVSETCALFLVKCDAGWPLDTSSPRPTSPPSGAMTRARVKALHDKVNSLLTTLDLGTPLDGLLPHADTLCVIRYKEHQDPGEDDTPWSREGEEQLVDKMPVELDPTSCEARQGREGASRPRTRSDRPPDRAARSKPDAALTPTGRSTETPCQGREEARRSRFRSDRAPDRAARSKPDAPLMPTERSTETLEPPPVTLRSRTRFGPDAPAPGPV